MFSEQPNDDWSLFAILISVLLLLLLNALICTVFCWIRKKNTQKIPPMTWATNTLYESNESIYDHASDINQKHQSLLPEWLSTKKHMIYSQTSVEKEHEIGHGQYGTVFKGKVVLGNSV